MLACGQRAPGLKSFKVLCGLEIKNKIKIPIILVCLSIDEDKTVYPF